MVREAALLRLNELASNRALDSFRFYASVKLDADQLLQILTVLNAAEFSDLRSAALRMALLIASQERLPALNADPVVGEIHFRRLEILVNLQNYDAALEQAEVLLNAPGNYRYFEVKTFRAAAKAGLKDFTGARIDCQEVLASGDPATARLGNLVMAEIWRAEKEYAKAVAAAWVAVPFAGVGRLPQAEKDIVKRALQLIVECAGYISSEIDIAEANALLKQIN